MQNSAPLALYIHIPFCERHCAYCDFNTYVEKLQNGIVQRTVDAIRCDIEQTALSAADRVIGSVFFGGGTPTFLTGEQITSILQTARDCWPFQPDAEISSEANPGSSDSDKFGAMRRAGFNRLSIGVQSFDADVLCALDRTHTASDAEMALTAARCAGFENVSLDLMFGLPRQTLGLWAESLRRACILGPEHLSLYSLTLEPGTRFERLHAGGKLALPDEETELRMYEYSIEMLESSGYEHYEVSNFAQPGYRCRHNQVYWNNGDYLGFGPGAVSYVNGARFKRERIPARYIAKQQARESLIIESETLADDAALGETMMLGLRLRDGVDTSAIHERCGIDPLVHYREQIDKLEVNGLLIRQGATLRLSHRGLLFANDVLSEFVV